MTDLISKIGVFGLDDAITTFIARSQAVGDHARSRVLFRLAVLLALVQSTLTAAILIAAIHVFGDHLGLQREMVSALAVVLCALPGIALYRVSTSISRGMKVMKHDIYSRGMTEPTATTLALLIALAIGFKDFAPVVAGMTATGDHERAAHTYARLAQWMLWILLPLVGALALSGGIILMIYGPAFHQGAAWLGIVGIACATTAFVSLGETVIMVQRPRLNLFNSSITCVVAVGANLWLIPRFGVMGAAFGILIPYVVQGVLRFFVLRLVFGWQTPWRSIHPPVLTAIRAFLPALPCRLFLPGMAGQLTAGFVFLAIFGV